MPQEIVTTRKILVLTTSKGLFTLRVNVILTVKGYDYISGDGVLNGAMGSRPMFAVNVPSPPTQRKKLTDAGLLPLSVNEP